MAAARAPLAVLLLNERLADPAADLLARDDLRQRERRRAHREQLADRHGLLVALAHARRPDQTGEQDCVDGVQLRVVDWFDGSSVVVGVHRLQVTGSGTVETAWSTGRSPARSRA